MEPSAIVISVFFVGNFPAGNAFVVETQCLLHLGLKLVRLHVLLFNDLVAVLLEKVIELLAHFLEVPTALQIFGVPSIASILRPRTFPVLVQPLLDLGIFLCFLDRFIHLFESVLERL